MNHPARHLACAAAALALLLPSADLSAAEFRLGSQIAMSGALARVGMATNEGVNVAVEMFNRAHQGRHTASLITVDDESNPAKAVAAIEQMAPQVQAFSGGYGSNIIGPASETAERAGKVYMTSGGVASELVKRGLTNFFRINNGEGYSRALVGMLNDLDIRSVAILHSTKDATQEVAHQVEEGLVANGTKVSFHAFDPAISDFKPILHKVKVLDKPDAIVMVGYENDYVGILRAARVMQPGVKLIAGVWSLATGKMANDFPELMQNVVGTSTLPYPVAFTDPEAQEFAKVYRDLYKKSPDYLGVFGYVQTRLLLDAMLRAEEAGTLDQPGAVAAELRKPLNDTLIGPVRFDETGDNPEFTHRMGQHQGKQVVLVWPEKAATGPVKFPATPWTTPRVASE
ncbi:ABC transporter substrate-binding protein [Skermanella rosea]|uniref:ABC transporter substrate-binding protein n=1 Tax=Skermanella rosea TaxID=1817965 RepID=UPI0019349DBF|nr:ABC transporter substrate-binding protein [Skermanella rosea]UEM01329.1 ABC transporter substrate-binding protein [Skermanella rosea]